MEDMIDGVEIKLGRKALIVPPLNFKALQRLRPQIKLLAGIGVGGEEITDEQLDAVYEVVHTALLRNYPNMSREDLTDSLDLGNVGLVLKAIMSGSGLTPSGEVRPATT